MSSTTREGERSSIRTARGAANTASLPIGSR